MTLILGARGQLGTAFCSLLPDALTPERSEFDLADISTIAGKIAALRPSLIINCAAFTAVDAAEGDRETAMLVNGAAVGELARAAHGLGVRFVSFSTDYVFDGATNAPYTEASSPAPINVYGESKLWGEHAALHYPGTLIVRSSWFFSATHPNFVATILSKAADGPVRVVADQWGRPTSVGALARTTLQAIRSGATGLLHLASRPTTTWFELAQEACRMADIDGGRIEACSSEELTRPARRPRCAALDTERDFAMPDWREELGDVIAAINGGWGWTPHAAVPR